MKVVIALLLIGGLLTADAQPKHGTKHLDGETMVSTNECIAKAGIGIITAHLYVDLRSAKNELILDGGNRWVGQDRGAEEVVYLFGNKAWTSVPSGFDLGNAILISFEGNNVRFFDFSRTLGGYYKRP